MRTFALLGTLGFLALAFAGCADNDTDAADGGDAAGLLYAGPALYEDPQNTPHPAYNWPTVSHPAVGDNVPYWWEPINASALPQALSGMEHLTETPGVESGAGIALFGRLAVVPGYGAPTSIVDVSDPTNPVVLSQIESQLANHRGAAFIAYPTGRLVTVIATSGGLDVWDITDPTAPVGLAPVEVPSHKVGVVPGTPIVYNAGSAGGADNGIAGPEAQTGAGVGVTEMFDFSDPENIVRLPDFQNGYSCHHIYFWNNVTEGKYRSLCAGIEYTQIIDTTDPLNPSVIVSVPFGHGMADLPSGSVFLAAFSHYAGLSTDGKVLLVGDESGGGLGPIGCVARVDTPAGAVSVPNGAVWFYDVSDETNPRYLGHVSASQIERMLSIDPNGVDPTDPEGTIFNQASCTAHHGRLVPVPGRDVLAMSFYGAGVILIDFTEVRNELGGLPTVVDQWAGPGANVWETWYYNGYLFTGDLGRGMDTLRLV